MKEFIVKEFAVATPSGVPVFDLRTTVLHQCTGCWNCWLKTPGRCMFRDLDEFYRNYLAADKVTFYVDVSLGFVTSNMKALIDRMIPFVLPYISWASGESLHEARYTRYPAVEVVYRGDFLPGEEDAFVAYWERSMYMMFAPSFSARRYDTTCYGDGIAGDEPDDQLSCEESACARF